jgi:hypothetical protein
VRPPRFRTGSPATLAGIGCAQEAVESFAGIVEDVLSEHRRDLLPVVVDWLVVGGAPHRAAAVGDSVTR